MLRIAKMTDYAVVLVTQLSTEPWVQSAAALSAGSGIPLPTVHKIVKQLLRHGLLVSKRGMHGGYALASPPTQLPVLAVIEAMEGPVAITECSIDAGHCTHQSHCRVQGNWRQINAAIQQALESISVAHMAESSLVPLRLHPVAAASMPPTPDAVKPTDPTMPQAEMPVTAVSERRSGATYVLGAQPQAPKCTAVGPCPGARPRIDLGNRVAIPLNSSMNQNSRTA